MSRISPWFLLFCSLMGWIFSSETLYYYQSYIYSYLWIVVFTTFKMLRIWNICQFCIQLIFRFLAWEDGNSDFKLWRNAMVCFAYQIENQDAIIRLISAKISYKLFILDISKSLRVRPKNCLSDFILMEFNRPSPAPVSCLAHKSWALAHFELIQIQTWISKRLP